MASHISTDSDVVSPHFGHAWRDNDSGKGYAVARLGAATIFFDSPDDARAVAAACVQAANALEALPPAPEGGQS